MRSTQFSLILCLLAFVIVPSVAHAQADTTTSDAIIARRRLAVADPCRTGQRVEFPARILIRLATDVGAQLQTVRLRARVESDRDGGSGTD